MFFMVSCGLVLFSLICTYFNFDKDVFFKFFKKYDNVRFCYVLDDYWGENAAEFNLKTQLKEVKNGAKTMVYFDNLGYKNNHSIKKARYKQAIFESKYCDLQTIILNLNAKILFNENFEDKKIYYAISPFFDDFVFLYGIKINLQFVVSNVEIIIGTPMIYISY